MQNDLLKIAEHAFEASRDQELGRTARITLDRLARLCEWLAGVRYTKEDLAS